MRVHKFGGTSLLDAQRIRRAGELAMADGGERRAIVVSAMGGITDELYAICAAAEARDGAWRGRFSDALDRYRGAARELLGAEVDGFIASLDEDARGLEDLIRAAWLLGTAGEESKAFVVGHGELWSARLLAAHLRSLGHEAESIDARDVLVVEENPTTGIRVDFLTTAEKLRGLGQGAPTRVITGFICRDQAGVVTTLRRNGSDHTASIFGNLLDAEEIVIWSDVDGVLSADPRRVPDAVTTSQLSYREAAELSYFGAKVLHPQTMGPAVDKRIPIRLRNTLNPDAAGTLITLEAAKGAGPVKGFASIDEVALVNVEGRGMIGVPGVAQRLFGALREVGVSVILIAQASSEQSICFAIPEADAHKAKMTLEQVFFAELAQKKISHINVTTGCSILSAVGEDMAHVPGVSGRLLTALGKVDVNIRAMAQGASERNISVVVDQPESTRALRAAHAAFYLSEQTLAIGLIGPGLIGKELLAQLAAERVNLKERYGIHLVLRGVLRSSKMALGDPVVDLEDWESSLTEAPGIETFIQHLDTERIPHACVIDCTAADTFSDQYASWLARRVHVITPNKKPNTGPWSRYQEIRETATSSHAHYFYEATVGAGLPVIATLRDLLLTGDRVKRIEGVLSGTLSFLMNGLSPDESFAARVADARARGFTEPDPRDDLSGMDVARKALTLARELGLDLELSDVEVESLIPAGLEDADTAEAFLDGLKAHDDDMKARAKAAAAEGQVLRYVAVIDAEARAVKVGLRAVPASDALGGLTGTDNLIAFTTDRYLEQPLIVRGPGAGPAVTAGGVFADVLRLCARLGARS
jgi:aspartokinase/homoserine dehydrogenase 1